MSAETKIGIPLIVFGGWALWLSNQVIDIRERMAKVEGSLESRSVAHVPLPPPPSLPVYPVDVAINFPTVRGRQP